MKICPTCKACYEDQDVSCRQRRHEQLVVERSGSRLIGGKYRLDFRLGHGGTGAVYQCTHLELNHPLAIKLLRSDFAENDPHGRLRLRREALTVCNFDHPNLVRLHDFGTNHVLNGENGQSESLDELFIVMELVEGHTLKDYLATHKRLSYSEALLIAIQIAAGLADVHAHGVVHRDLKPANIMLTYDRLGRLVVKILDFGAVKLIGQDPPFPDLDLTGQMFIGSPHYSSPESCTFKSLDGRSDIYCLGLILYEMLAGYRPYEATDFLGWLNQHTYATPRPLVGLPQPLANLVMRTLSKRPEDRAQSATELLSDLTQLLKSVEFAASPEISAAAEETDQDEVTVVASPVPHPRTKTQKAKPKAKGHSQNSQTAGKASVRNIVAIGALVLLVVLSLFLTVTFVRSSLTGTTADESPRSQSDTDAKEAGEFLTVTDVNIRTRPSGLSEKIGLAEKGSRVRVVAKHKNWRQIIVVEHGREKEDPESQDEGWIDGDNLSALSDERI